MSDGLALGVFRVSEFSNAVNHFAGFVADGIAEWQALDVNEDHRDEEGLAYQLESLALLLRMAGRARDEKGYGGTFTIGSEDIQGAPLDELEVPMSKSGAKRTAKQKAAARK